MGTERLGAEQFSTADTADTAAETVAPADDVGDMQSAAASPQDPPQAFDDTGEDNIQAATT